ncbi:hypothetical protein QNH98_03620 [Myroides sp. mNGS23_01]|nr:hypothetical protein [Myroides sp. mNGS23_01]WHT39782.1 hypothetical protein QNH98_03620 [Myroides sp. mNGS23_01]
MNTDPYFDESFESKIGGAKELLFPECENIMDLFAEAQKSEKNPIDSRYYWIHMKHA